DVGSAPGSGAASAIGSAAAGAASGAAAGSAPASGTGSGAPRLAWIDAQAGVAGQATLTQGGLLGAARGSTWAIYPPGETAFAPGRALALATVTGNIGLDARVALEPAGAHLEAGSRAVALMPAAAGLRVPVRILDVPEAQRLQIDSVLARAIKDVEIVGPERPARFLIDVGDSVLRLLSADGRQVLGTFDARTDSWADEVARVISRSSSASELLALDN